MASSVTFILCERASRSASSSALWWSALFSSSSTIRFCAFSSASSLCFFSAAICCCSALRSSLLMPRPSASGAKSAFLCRSSAAPLTCLPSDAFFRWSCRVLSHPWLSSSSSSSFALALASSLPPRPSAFMRAEFESFSFSLSLPARPSAFMMSESLSFFLSLPERPRAFMSSDCGSSGSWCSDSLNLSLPLRVCARLSKSEMPLFPLVRA
mmetsp:Transcript_53840/g.153523  ORF Transcript_53840/g.153523 Transcript_53840/m.153523 type:complete len:211 (-) Transcript_53840:975-1607(-)